jgi:hypothetical protein
VGWKTPAADYRRSACLDLDPYSLQNDRLVAALGERRLLSNVEAPNPDKMFFRSETSEVTIDGPNNRLILDTPRTAGGFAPRDGTIATAAAGVRILVSGSDATVWVSALDGNPIRSSHRLLVTHLTDLQNSEITYDEPARQTLQDWGRLPYLVRAGTAALTITSSSAAKMKVWALSPGGNRTGLVPSHADGDSLMFVADVGGDKSGGARMLYELNDVDEKAR